MTVDQLAIVYYVIAFGVAIGALGWMARTQPEVHTDVAALGCAACFAAIIGLLWGVLAFLGAFFGTLYGIAWLVVRPFRPRRRQDGPIQRR